MESSQKTMSSEKFRQMLETTEKLFNNGTYDHDNIGMQISLDDLVNGKPLANGQSSSEKVLENIQKVQSRNINFSFNTVLDIERTKDLTKLANFISSFNNVEWGLNASYTENDQNKVNEVIKIN